MDCINFKISQFDGLTIANQARKLCIFLGIATKLPRSASSTENPQSKAASSTDSFSFPPIPEIPKIIVLKVPWATKSVPIGSDLGEILHCTNL